MEHVSETADPWLRGKSRNKSGCASFVEGHCLLIGRNAEQISDISGGHVCHFSRFSTK